jgi:3',5'-cyclic AMP phosphodiesterase CpdA
MQPNTDTDDDDRTATHPSEALADELLTLARFDRPIAAERTRLAVIADPHLSPDAEGTGKLYHRGANRLRRAFDDAEERGVDAVVSVGDLTKDGAPEEYDQFDDVLDGLNLPFLSVPGNHDVPKARTDVYEYGDDHETPPVSRFVDRYTPGELPFYARLGELDLLGINTASTPDGELRESHDGKLSETQVEWLDRKLSDIDEAVVLMHHNLPQMYDQVRSYSDSVHPEMGMPPTMREPEALVETLTDHDVPLVLTGHLHMPGVAEAGAVRELTVPATCSYPQGYVLLDVGPRGTTASYVPVATTEGMTEAHGERRTGGETSRGLTAFSAIRLASAPLVDDWQD